MPELKPVFGRLARGAHAHKVAQMHRRRWVPFRSNTILFDTP